MSYTIAKKLVLARAILKKPKLLILEDPLDRFNAAETNEIIEYLTDKERPWGLIVVSSNNTWDKMCTELINLDRGVIKFKK